MAEFLLFCKSFPLVLNFDRLAAPLLADDLGYLWVGEAGMLSDDLGLVVLTVKDECYK